MPFIPAVLAALAIIVPGSTASPAPSSSPGTGALRTIVTVKSSPYCNALAEHFNSAIIPLAGNDRTLVSVGGDLDVVDDAFTHPDYANRLKKARDRIVAANDQIVASLPLIYSHITALRAASATTKDAQAAQEIVAVAAALQSAYAKQKQLSIDLTSLAASMMDLNASLGDRPLPGPESNQVPKEMRDLKAYLRFDGRRDLISQSEAKAVDLAYDAATSKCSAP